MATDATADHGYIGLSIANYVKASLTILSHPLAVLDRLVYNADSQGAGLAMGYCEQRQYCQTRHHCCCNLGRYCPLGHSDRAGLLACPGLVGC